MSTDNKDLVNRLKAAGIYERCRLAGVHNDMAGVYSATDVLALSSSHNEALSMALLEGTSTGCLCVSTDVGDHRRLMEATGGICVPARDPAALAAGIEAQLRLKGSEREAKKQKGRAVIIRDHNVNRMASSYNALFLEVAAEARDRGSERARSL